MASEAMIDGMAPQRAAGAKKEIWSWLNVWSIGTVLIAAAMTVPILAVLYIGLTPSDEIWSHLVDTVLPGYITTTLLLMIGVGVGTLLIGVSLGAEPQQSCRLSMGSISAGLSSL